MENGKEAALNERDSTVNCAKCSLAFFAQLETENVIFFFFSLPFAALVTQPTLVAAATKEAFTCPKNQSCKSETEKPGYVASCFPPFRIVDSYMFLRVSPKQGLESGGQTSRSEGSLHHVLPRGFLCTYSLLLGEGVSQADLHAQFPSFLHLIC